MSAATAHQPPVVPPRPTKSQDMPRVPPRPVKGRPDRAVSPNPDRFAPSPLNDGFLSTSPRKQRFSPQNGNNLSTMQPIERSTSVDLPSVGEEGKEYAAVTEERGTPEQTRTVGEDVKLYAPKPSLPAISAKQRVATVTRTDSDKAASFGIGRPSSEEATGSNRSLKKKASTASQLSTTESQSHVDDEQGIPEIGIQVPMYPNAGDVQAPSPAPNSDSTPQGQAFPKKHHNRRTSARGFAELPPGSYGLHGHGLLFKNKLESDYYTKHPELAKKDHHVYHEDRANDFSMSSDALNAIVRNTPSRLGSHEASTPREEIGWQAIEESASRINSPRPDSAEVDGRVTSPLKQGFNPEINVSGADDSDSVIHVDDPRRKSVMFADDDTPGSDGEEHSYQAPILAADEVAKDPGSSDHLPAIEPPLERRGSAFEIEEPHSRPTSRPASIYKESPFEARSTPLEDVDEYEPLFPEDEKGVKKPAAPAKKTDESERRFPSRDVWEDAPNSVHYTAEVSTPEVPEPEEVEEPPRETETPAHKFARQHEELAEKEARDPVHRKGKPLQPWAKSQSHLANEVATSSRPAIAHRFPSQDVWEDTPTSHMLETTVETTQEEESPSEAKQPNVPQRPARKSTDPSDKPAVPGRPKPKQTPPEDSSTTKPSIPDRPKPQVPARPAKQLSGSDKDAEPSSAKSKPAVPARMGGKIAALQAGFMSDLNKKLGLGPQAPKKEETVTQDLTEEKEKAPLADARKGRARGPQRRAPRSSPSPAAPAASSSSEPPAEKAAPSFTFTMATTVFSIDPDEGALHLNPDSIDEEPIETKTETLASNMAGESVVEAKITEDAEQTVEPVEIEEGAKE